MLKCKYKVAECWQMFVRKQELNVYCKIDVINCSSEMLCFYRDQTGYYSKKNTLKSKSLCLTGRLFSMPTLVSLVWS